MWRERSVSNAGLYCCQRPGGGTPVTATRSVLMEVKMPWLPEMTTTEITYEEQAILNWYLAKKQAWITASDENLGKLALAEETLVAIGRDLNVGAK